MRTIKQSRTAITAFATVLMVALSTPLVATAEENVLSLIPAAPAWDEASGYRSVEMSRAASTLYLAPTVGTAWEATSGYRSVEANRLLAAQQALRSGDLGSVQENVLSALVDAGSSRAAASDYDTVEAIRAEASGLIGFSSGS
jgi:hypothetical protein